MDFSAALSAVLGCLLARSRQCSNKHCVCGTSGAVEGVHGFVVVVQPPFVVIGDESPGMVWSRATNTVKWAVDQLKEDCSRKY